MQSPVVSKSKFHAAMIGESFVKCLERRRGVWWAIMGGFKNRQLEGVWMPLQNHYAERMSTTLVGLNDKITVKKLTLH